MLNGKMVQLETRAQAIKLLENCKDAPGADAEKLQQLKETAEVDLAFAPKPMIKYMEQGNFAQVSGRTFPLSPFFLASGFTYNKETKAHEREIERRPHVRAATGGRHRKRVGVRAGIACASEKVLCMAGR